MTRKIWLFCAMLTLGGIFIQSYSNWTAHHKVTARKKKRWENKRRNQYNIYLYTQSEFCYLFWLLNANYIHMISAYVWYWFGILLLFHFTYCVSMVLWKISVCDIQLGVCCNSTDGKNWRKKILKMARIRPLNWKQKLEYCKGIMSFTNYKYKMVLNACWDSVTPRSNT